ncbi:MAG: tRNA (adenosine(37)-N6)-dimethylallyltransferase MiaA [Ruminococcaceae bacterium]|nr:tRNA (adenosine(37)-N6)-dimethylallyltransferase MiaA [Oscillospiraceae bacterium]
MKNKTKILAVVGPTASGKSALAIELARALDGEIVCCDSMQIYRKMNIGTAAPTAEEKRAARHRLFGFRDPCKAYSCSDYEKSASRAIRDIAGRGKLPIICGGTGLYLDSLLFGVGGDGAEPDPEYRAELEKFAEANGADALHKMLEDIDPEAASAIHKNNVRRVIRALEICRAAGTKTEKDKKARQKGMRYDACVIGLRYADRSELADRIERRIEKMLDEGLVEETKALLAAGVFEANSTAAQAIGYKEILPYINGECSLLDAREKLLFATRKYAKRQITWFSAKPYVNFIDCDGIGDEEIYKKIVKNALDIFQKS